MKYRLLYCGDCAVTVEFSQKIDSAAGQKAMALSRQLADAELKGVEEIIPTYRSVTVCFDPIVLSGKELIRTVKKIMRRLQTGGGQQRRLLHVPVCYGGKFGADLDDVARETGLSPREVVYRHIRRDYLINMIGFLPGFPYLSGMDETIAVPRLANPREVIPAGSVGIGGVQTGIYPIASPGGWRLIGRTPLKPYDPNREPAILYRAGDMLRFLPITEEQYAEIEAEVLAGTYQPQWEEVESAW